MLAAAPGSARDPSFEWPDLSDDEPDAVDSLSRRHDASVRASLTNMLPRDDDQDDKLAQTTFARTTAPSDTAKATTLRTLRLRRVQLGLACCMSIGSHFGAYLLGPVKQNLHTSEHGFASLVSSFQGKKTSVIQLVNTVTPLVSNAFVLRFGAPKTALGATGTVLVGQAIVVWAQRNGTEGQEALNGMITGLFCFGLGLAPIAVCQESIILKQNSSHSKTVARSVAVGLLFGKTAAFLAACTAEPMASISPRMPFIVACLVALFSFACCVMYNHIDKSLPPFETQDPVEGVSSTGFSCDKLLESKSYGDPFWLYAIVCSLAGAWYSTIHLSSSMLQVLYNVSEAKASAAASVILFSSTVLYPILGTLVDMRPHILRNLYFAVPLAILTSYISMLYLTWLVPFWLAAVPAAIGIGHAPTALAIHKSVEMAGAVLCQSWTGSILSTSKSTTEAVLEGGPMAKTLFDRQGYSRVVLVLGLLVSIQLLVIVVWWWIVVPNRQSEEESARLEYALAPRERTDEPTDWDDDDDDDEDGHALTKEFEQSMKESRSEKESRRGSVAINFAIGLVALAWLSFLVTLGMA
ncbi:hypothetical protein OIV83_001627 [Microbotryomycetes sp. JL201]|nr:hypothetical protein OIV83_001627 [Microbotryomycetes sp. JL201]